MSIDIEMFLVKPVVVRVKVGMYSRQIGIWQRRRRVVVRLNVLPVTCTTQGRSRRSLPGLAVDELAFGEEDEVVVVELIDGLRWLSP